MSSHTKKIGAIILAAGGSTRMGQPKLLLDWHGQPLIRWVARTALASGCAPVIVVTGAGAAAVVQSLKGLTVDCIHNPNWQLGQSTSVRAGVRSLPVWLDAALVFLGDQPQIPLEVVLKLIDEYCQEDPPPPIVLPVSGGRRGNPVLFDRSLLQELTRLEGDAGARVLFSRYQVRMVETAEADLLLDVDSPEDYQRLMTKPPPDPPPENA